MFTFLKEKTKTTTCPKNIPDCTVEHGLTPNSSLKSEGSFVVGDYAANKAITAHNSIVLGPGAGNDDLVHKNALIIEINNMMVHKKITDQEAYFIKRFGESVIKFVHLQIIEQLPKIEYTSNDYAKAIEDVKQIILKKVSHL